MLPWYPCKVLVFPHKIRGVNITKELSECVFNKRKATSGESSAVMYLGVEKKTGTGRRKNLREERAIPPRKGSRWEVGRQGLSCR